MRHPAVAVAFALLALGCTSPTEMLLPPEAAQLVGRWQTAPENVNVAGAGGAILKTGSYQITLSLNVNGDAVVDTRSYGMYGSQRTTDLSAYTTNSGTFRVVGDSLTLELTRSVWWDAFYGTNSPEHIETLPPGRTQPSKFRIDGNKLILDYLSYPLDAPVPTTAIYFRAN
jgi:hypothetical protein